MGVLINISYIVGLISHESKYICCENPFSYLQSVMADVYTNPDKHVVLHNNVKMPILGLGKKSYRVFQQYLVYT